MAAVAIGSVKFHKLQECPSNESSPINYRKCMEMIN